MLVARREKRSASHASGTPKSMGSTSCSAAGCGTRANQVNNASTSATTHQPSHAFAAGRSSAKPPIMPKVTGAKVTMPSTEARSQSPMSARSTPGPADCDSVAAPMSEPGATPTLRATIQSGERTSCRRSPVNSRKSRARLAAPTLVETLAATNPSVIPSAGCGSA